MTINWPKIQTNVVSVIICAIVLGAFTIVWRGATSVEDKVDSGLEEIKTVQKGLHETHVVIGPKVDRLEVKVEEIIRLLTESDVNAIKIRKRGLGPLRDTREPRIPASQMIQSRVHDWESKRKKK